MRGAMAVLMVLTAGLLPAACANPQAEQALEAPRTLVGLAETDLLACAGVPERRVTGQGGADDLIYAMSRTRVDRDVSWEADPWLGAAGVRAYRPDVSTWSRTYRCEATVTVRDGRVAAVRYNDRRDLDLCYALLGTCLSR
ncbi:hypothetical protein [Azospirillum halopraeferens]|uniref:hypothetical protein n=1 Tax=Azospirillum halopraeferens TaxID=34010 RepID=UPI000427FC86|nr:hypothetical protein [Azospirillum halopraeferens]